MVLHFGFCYLLPNAIAIYKVYFKNKRLKSINPFEGRDKLFWFSYWGS